jgi:hypothetical protein
MRWCRTAALILAGVALARAAAAQARFVTVFQNANESEADRLLARVLGAALIDAPEEHDYDAVIADLIADERAGGIVARVTPYALVVAEMRGAKLEPIATYRSRSTHRAEGQPATFVFHNKLSTSSYFLPSLMFRAQKVFAADTRTASSAGVTTLRVEHLDTKSSSDLVKAVATGRADLASVWESTKNHTSFGSQVWFVPLAATLPCDVLVATRRVNTDTKHQIAATLEKRSPIASASETPWDVETWIPWKDPEADEAHRALSDLRRSAAASAVPVIVEVRDGAAAPLGAAGLDAVRSAIRLSGTELVDRSEYYDYYDKSDIRWELERIHDGAVRITIRYADFKLAGTEVTQQFELSFVGPTDLTKRVVSLIHSRLHRIRPVWLYLDSVPTVLRDVGFDIGDRVPFQTIEWHDPQRNAYQLRGLPGEARLEKNDFNFELAQASFPMRTDGRLDFDPMGQQAFRVLLIRPAHERVLFQALTIALIGLFGSAGVGLVWDLRRRTPRVAAPSMRTAPTSLQIPGAA